MTIVTNNTNETLKHMKHYWDKRDPNQHTAADKEDAPDSDCMMLAALSWGHTQIAKSMRDMRNMRGDEYTKSNWDKTLGVQEWNIVVQHTHLMMTQRSVWAKKTDTDSHCPLVVTIRSAYQSGQRTRGQHGMQQRHERNMKRMAERGIGKSSDKGKSESKGKAKGKFYKGKNK